MGDDAEKATERKDSIMCCSSPSYNKLQVSLGAFWYHFCFLFVFFFKYFCLKNNKLVL
jgi:hypothetical protein